MISMIANKSFKGIYESIVGTEDEIKVDRILFKKKDIESFDIDEIKDSLWRVSVRYILGTNDPPWGTPIHSFGIYEGTKEECEKIAYTLQDLYPE